MIKSEVCTCKCVCKILRLESINKESREIKVFISFFLIVSAEFRMNFWKLKEFKGQPMKGIDGFHNNCCPRFVWMLPLILTQPDTLPAHTCLQNGKSSTRSQLPSQLFTRNQERHRFKMQGYKWVWLWVWEEVTKILPLVRFNYVQVALRQTLNGKLLTANRRSLQNIRTKNLQRRR